MANAYQSFEELLAQEAHDWAFFWSHRNVSANDAPPFSDGTNAWDSVPTELGVLDSNWDLSSRILPRNIAPWQTSDTINGDRQQSIWEEVSQTAFIHDMSVENTPTVALPPQSALLSTDDFPGQHVAGHIFQHNEFTATISEHDLSPRDGECPLNIFHKLAYPGTTCASCGAPLHTSEDTLLDSDSFDVCCTRNKAIGHLPLVCDENGCGLKFRKFKDLIDHSNATSHLPICCAVPGCRQRLQGWSRWVHFTDCHPQIWYSCAQCGLVFDRMALLDGHGSDTMHAAYVCKYDDCGSESTRFADLLRHQLVHKDDVPRHPCPHCRSYRGSNGFKRKDHLRQHVRNYHRIDNLIDGKKRSLFACRNTACEGNYQTLEHTTLEQLTDHMLLCHGSSPYVCENTPCDRVMMNGFETDKLLKQHLKNDHPSPFQCHYPGCHRVGSKGWMRERIMVKHMKNAHGITK